MSTQQMTSADTAWLHMDRPTNPMVVNAVLWFDEHMDLERARAVIGERLVGRFPRFRQRVVEPRMHHSIADGIALARVLFSMTDEEPDAGIEPEGARGRSRGRLSGLVRR